MSDADADLTDLITIEGDGVLGDEFVRDLVRLAIDLCLEEESNQQERPTAETMTNVKTFF